jgi:hypothetical protein
MNFMQKKVSTAIVLALIILAIFIFILIQKKQKETKEYFYLLELNYNQGNLSLLNISLKDGHFSEPLWQPENGWKAEIISLKNEILYSLKFIPNQIQVFWAPSNEKESPPGPISPDNFTFALSLPYFREANIINIYDPQGNLKLSKDVSFLKPK